MCHKQLGTLGSRNRNFLYDGDTVSEGELMSLSAVYPDLLRDFAAVLNSAGSHDSAILDVLLLQSMITVACRSFPSCETFLFARK